jgi:CBS domain-containing protein
METVRQLLDAKGSQIYSIGPDEKVIDALKVMAEEDVGALVVLDGARLVGIISERDYARKVALLGKTAADVPVRDIMSAEVVTVAPERTVEECMTLVTSRRVRHLPVCEGDRLVGLVSIGDLVKVVIADQELTIRQLESYIRS